jgi:hypothetical protein
LRWAMGGALKRRKRRECVYNALHLPRKSLNKPDFFSQNFSRSLSTQSLLSKNDWQTICEFSLRVLVNLSKQVKIVDNIS